MSDSPQPFTTRQMYILGNGNEERCSYDFSLLAFEDYTKFFYALPNILYKRVKSVCFNNTFYSDYSRDGRHSRKRELLIFDSIFYQKPRYIKYLIKILTRVLPQTKTLEEIEFADIKINPDLLNKLFEAIGKSPNIKSIKFSEVPIGDDLFKKLLKHLSPYQIESLNMFNTSLTPKSLHLVNKFIEQADEDKTLTKTLKTIDINQDDFPAKRLKQIKSRKIDDDEKDDWDSEPQWATMQNPVTEGMTLPSLETTKDKSSTHTREEVSGEEEEENTNSNEEIKRTNVSSKSDSENIKNSDEEPVYHTVSTDKTPTTPEEKPEKDSDSHSHTKSVESHNSLDNSPSKNEEPPSKDESTKTPTKDFESHTSTSTNDPERNLIIHKLMEETFIEANRAVEDASLLGNKSITAEGNPEPISIEERAIDPIPIESNSSDIDEKDLFVDSEPHDAQNLKVTDSETKDEEEEYKDYTEIIDQYEDVYTLVSEKSSEKN
ncbi:hypothetical protein TVAG_439910 [Trichomonas vaginalis G3]|uniref:Uncharacterized protein n=1 Tax=Trichomonas vaginalis (strain ATCC PRA-98 / G3) TaxID=412133 RepID=A2G0E8_TRIV3|nr:ribonuclease inhibitor domain-containing protein [Trichomonas vaginalis G3]EAX89371.1 hypothetical protein TVAG_439910 [Trichomonas vaginalis G3]KAI5513063.1 ribonuclease inhibitor domain-containing protein [Trichomonas vaginalis G3]|eukprot:XP_001302301.1 hypothetical protein [Trichomonas vaginalis G3]